MNESHGQFQGMEAQCFAASVMAQRVELLLVTPAPQTTALD